MFYGFWINDKKIKSDKAGFESNRRNRKITMIIGIILSLTGIWLVIKSSKTRIF